MEDVLDLYTAAPSVDEPLICMDESNKQLLGDRESPVPMKRGRPAREDYTYERHGVQSIFMFFDPVRGWRRTSIRAHRTRVDWAEEVRILLEVDYPHARRVKLVCDNLNTHHIASLYEAFPAHQARRLARRLEIHFTPRHGSWLNVAEIELSALCRSCLDRRISSAKEMRQETTAWSDERNRHATGVSWRFTTEDARIKLRSLYPQV